MGIRTRGRVRPCSCLIRRNQGQTPQRSEGVDMVFTTVAIIEVGGLGNLVSVCDRLMQHRLRLLLVIRRVRCVGGDNELCRRIDYGFAIIRLPEGLVARELPKSPLEFSERLSLFIMSPSSPGQLWIRLAIASPVLLGLRNTSSK